MTTPTLDDVAQRWEARPDYTRPAAYAVGLATYSLDPTGEDSNGQRPPAAEPAAGARPLDTWFPMVNLQEHYRVAAALAAEVGHTAGSASYRLNVEQLDHLAQLFEPAMAGGGSHPNMEGVLALRQAMRRRAEQSSSAGLHIPRGVVLTFIRSLDDQPVDVHDCYLRLHLLSHRKVQPRGLNLDGLVGMLPNVVWTSEGPLAPETFEHAKLQCLARGVHLRVFSVDKFPHLTDYVVPSGVRIADASRVRLGAHLAEGTTVMQEGFCNFNAGTLGPSMVEGRISQGVIVGAGSDIGGGASIMGTLSGGGKEVITIGAGCLLGANSGTGISLGDGCQVQQGVYVLSNGPIRLQPEGRVVRTWELSGKPNLRYWRNSLTGELEAGPTKSAVELNPDLHAKQ
jgi:2,3,4,5-tetrahydropyridine-2-carboxylate N-succinyltransferase